MLLYPLCTPLSLSLSFPLIHSHTHVLEQMPQYDTKIMLDFYLFQVAELFDKLCPDATFPSNSVPKLIMRRLNKFAKLDHQGPAT